MKATKNIMQSLQNLNYKYDRDVVCAKIKELEQIIQKNIEQDEVSSSSSNSFINEKIKKIIVDTQFIMLSNDRPESIKIFLDDKRSTPDGYVRIFWPDDIYLFLTTFNVEEISLDHDLGDDDIGTGYDVVNLIEKWVYLENYQPPFLKVHSDNSSAKSKMLNGINNIIKISKNNKQNRSIFPDFIMKK